ncbi:unnamed protein product, partial [Rotaria sp. Silwood1]
MKSVSSKVERNNANQKTCCKSRDDQSSKFYNIIPHDFGKTRSKSIDNPEALQQKYDMLAVLDNVELASSIRPDKDNKLIEPDPKDDVEITIDGKKVIIPI